MSYHMRKSMYGPAFRAVEPPQGAVGLQSTMDEEIEEGGPTSKTTLSGEHGRQSKAK
ncbi:unnamed protein product, partial [Boreogadus saida]